MQVTARFMLPSLVTRLLKHLLGFCSWRLHAWAWETKTQSTGPQSPLWWSRSATTRASSLANPMRAIALAMFCLVSHTDAPLHWAHKLHITVGTRSAQKEQGRSVLLIQAGFDVCHYPQASCIKVVLHSLECKCKGQESLSSVKSCRPTLHVTFAAVSSLG